jgi:hypothetical protein
MKNVECRNKRAGRGAGLARAIRHSSFVILLGLFCALLPAKGFGQSSNRWLFVFNTSSAMRDRAKGVQAVTQDLLTTAMHGNIRQGDSIGIWTFDAKLNAEEAPLQNWHADTAIGVVQNTLRFVSSHPYKNSAAFGDVLTNMLRVIKMSDVITVILISDGSESFKGTPSDAQLNTFYKKNYSPQKRAHMPVVTVLRGENGRITTNTVNLAPWPVDIPPVPVQIVTKAAPAKAAPAKPVPPPVVPSLVIIGKKAQSTTNVPLDLPDHSGDLPDSMVTQTKPAEVPAPVLAPAPEPAPAPKVEEKTVAPPVAVVEPKAPVAPMVETPKPTAPAEAQAATDASSNQSPAKVDATQPGAETAVSVPSKSLFSARNIAIVSVAFTVLVCGLLFISARNSRRASRASLITRSLDREDK